jgi:hypothetical protein
MLANTRICSSNGALSLFFGRFQKEAEVHLPELKTRDGISIPMEDIGTSRVWNMRYR